VTATFAPGSAAELAEWLRQGRPRVRLCGSDSRRRRTRPAAPAAAVLTLAGLDRIERFVADDLTCSVQPGVRRSDLDLALAERGLELGCAGGGTIGGLFAADPIGATVPGGPQPRNLLLGIEAVLADGTPFKCGARVVKSVAGFDVHKLFVGSAGRLCAATLLHLKLRPRARARLDFAEHRLDAAAALAKFAALRALPTGPNRLWLTRTAGGMALGGQAAGRASQVAALQRTHALAEGSPAHPDQLDAAAAGEVVAGIVRWSRVPSLLAALPANAPFLLHGGGRFEVALSPAESDALLLVLPSLDAAGCIVAGADDRRGRGTPLDRGAEQLQRGLERALDPAGVLQ
jgi:FAD/FMN-containing dehydrogenase